MLSPILVSKDIKFYAESHGYSIDKAVQELLSLVPEATKHEYSNLSQYVLAWMGLKLYEGVPYETIIKEIDSFSSAERYPFKRKTYDEILNALSEVRVICLLGPRKCGKTVCLQQLSNLSNTVYLNFKIEGEVYGQVYDAIINNSDVTYLLDEITYLKSPERFIRHIAGLYEEYNSNTRIVITGSQSFALRKWASIAFSGFNIKNIYMSFMNYDEWLIYRGLDPSVDSYTRFLFDISTFYNMPSIKEYVQGCIDETIVSNDHTLEIIYGNDCDSISSDTITSIMYMTLYTLHNRVNAKTFSSKDSLKYTIQYHFKDICEKLDLDIHIANSFIQKYNNVEKFDSKTLGQSFLFLKNNDLITITNVSQDFDNLLDFSKELSKLAFHKESVLQSKDAMLEVFNFCTKYPMFYVAILKDILGHSLTSIPNALLGSIVECHARGLLPDSFTTEYHDLDGREIDYVDTVNKFAIEFKITDNFKVSKYLGIIPSDYKLIILTKTMEFIDSNGVTYIPYWKFLAMSSEEIKEFLGVI